MINTPADFLIDRTAYTIKLFITFLYNMTV